MEVNGVPNMRDRRQNYLSYLLRVWRTGGEKDSVWLSSLTNPFTGEELGFSTLQELLAFIQSQVDEKERRASEENEPGLGV